MTRIMHPSDFANADLQKVVDELTTDEAISLIAGVGFWHTAAVPRLGIPAIKVSDGPNGIRGNHFFMGTPAKCLPVRVCTGRHVMRISNVNPPSLQLPLEPPSILNSSIPSDSSSLLLKQNSGQPRWL